MDNRFVSKRKRAGIYLNVPGEFEFSELEDANVVDAELRARIRAFYENRYNNIVEVGEVAESQPSRFQRFLSYLRGY